VIREEDVEGWAAEGATGGVRLRARLFPLHADAARWAFEAAALRARLGLEDGLPWRLELACEDLPGDPAPTPEASLEVGAPTGGPASAREPRAFELGGLAVRHDGGWILPAVPSAPAPAPGAVCDPLRSLLAAPAEALVPGRELSLVLWGPRPMGSPVLVRRTGPAEPLGETLLALAPERVSPALVSRTLARLEREERR